VRGNLCLRCGQQHHTPHFSEPQRCFYIERGKHRFHRYRIRCELFHELRDQLVNLSQARRKRRAQRQLQRAESQQLRPRALEFDDSVAGCARDGRINTKHAHASESVYIVGSDGRHLGRAQVYVRAKAER